jgi:MFS family permease
MTVGAVGISVPIYANRLGASPFFVGLIGSAGGLVYSFMPLVSGVLCDRLKRKAFISASLISYGFSCLLYNFTEEPFMLVFIKILEGLSVAAFWPAMESLIADSADVRLEEALRRFNVSWGSAMLIGPMLGGALISGWSIKAPFLFSPFISFFFGLLSFVFVAEPPKRRVGEKPSTFEGGDDGEMQGSITTALASIFLFSSVGGIIFALFPSYATDLGILPFEIGLITFAFGAARTITFYQANRIEARLGKNGMFLLGSLVLAFGSLLTFSSTSIPMFAICFTIFGFGSSISYAASIAFILGRWESSRGYAAGVFESLIGLGYFAGPLIGGAISEHAPNAPYMYGFVLGLTVFFIQLVSRRKVSTVQVAHF